MLLIKVSGSTAPPGSLPVPTLTLSPESISENGGGTTVTAALSRAFYADTTITVSATAVSPATNGDFTLRPVRP